MLFGGANAYNSYFDKDTGPIGGLKNPPKMQRWMYFVSWGIQIIGLVISYLTSTNVFTFLFFIAIITFWAYSSPIIRFKGRPLLSLFAIGIGTVINSTLMGYIAAGGEVISMSLLLGACGSMMIILSLYPFSQAYQIEEDRSRGDITFAVRYGIQGVRKMFLISFPIGIFIITIALYDHLKFWFMVPLLGLLVFLVQWQRVKKIVGKTAEYKQIMLTKYWGGLFFTITVIFLLALKGRV